MMTRKFDIVTSLPVYICVLYVTITIDYCHSVDLYITTFDDFRIKEKSDPIPTVTRDLQYSVDYIRNPCKLAETGEISPMLTVDELQRQYKESKKALLSQDQFEKSRLLFHKMVLEGHLLTACLIRVEFGKEKAEKIIDKWISGYENIELKRIQEQNLKSVLDIAESALTQQQCRHWVVMATRYGDFDVPGVTSVQTVVTYITDKLEIGDGSLARIGPAAGSITLKCLQSADLSKQEKERLSALVGVGLAFTYELVGGVMSRELGHHGSADLLRVIAHELNRAQYLERDEIKKRVRFLVSGYRQSDMCKTVKSDLDCVEVVEADFTMHTPRDKKHNGGNISPMTPKVPQKLTQKITKKPDEKQPLVSEMIKHPGMQHLEELLLPNKQASVSPAHTSDGAHFDPHSHHFLTSGDHLMQKVQSMDNPLVTALMENKNPMLLHALEDGGNPQLLQSLLNMPDKNEVESLLNMPRPSNKQPHLSPVGMNKLLAAFNGDRHQLLQAIKARAKMKLLAYLRKHENEKLMEYLKAKKQKQNGGKQDENKLRLHGLTPMKDEQKIHHLMHLAEHHEHNEAPKISPDIELELTKVVQKVKEAKEKKKPAKKPSFLTPSKEILEELKEELKGVRPKPKPKTEYYDNSLVHFGDYSDNYDDMTSNNHPHIDHNGDRGDDVHDIHDVHDYNAESQEHMNHHTYHHRPLEWQPSEPVMLPPSILNQPHRHLSPDAINIYKYREPLHMSKTEHTSPQQPAVLDANDLKTIDSKVDGAGHSGVDGQKEANIKNILSGFSDKNIDEHDMESVMSNLPGIMGQHVENKEVGSILASMEKSKQKGNFEIQTTVPSEITLQGADKMRNEQNKVLVEAGEGKELNGVVQGTEVTGAGQVNELPSMAPGKELPEGGQGKELPEGGQAKELLMTEQGKQRLAVGQNSGFLGTKELPETVQGKEVLNNGFFGVAQGKQPPEAGMTKELLGTTQSNEVLEMKQNNVQSDNTLRPELGADAPDQIQGASSTSKPKPIEIFQPADQKENSPLAQQSELDAVNYAGATDPDTKSKPDVLNLDGGIDGIEGLDAGMHRTSNTEEPNSEGPISMVNPVSEFAKAQPPNTDLPIIPINDDIGDELNHGKFASMRKNPENEAEDFAELKHQEEFDKNALKTEEKMRQGQEIRINDFGSDDGLGNHLNEGMVGGDSNQHSLDNVLGDMGFGKQIGGQGSKDDPIETIVEMNHQEQFDKNALSNDNQRTVEVSAGNKVGASYLETMQEFAEQPRLKTLGGKYHGNEAVKSGNEAMKTGNHAEKSPLNDIMAEIQKQDAIDQAYNKKYYPSSNGRSSDASSALFDETLNYAQKKWLKKPGKGKSAKNTGVLVNELDPGLINRAESRKKVLKRSKQKFGKEVKMKGKHRAVRVKRIYKKKKSLGNKKI